MLCVHLGNFLAACGISFLFLFPLLCEQISPVGTLCSSQLSPSREQHQQHELVLPVFSGTWAGGHIPELVWPRASPGGLAGNGNSVAAAGALGLLGLTGLFMASSHCRKCGAVNPSCFRPPQQLQFMILMVCSTQSCLNSSFVSLTSALLWLSG